MRRPYQMLEIISYLKICIWDKICKKSVSISIHLSFCICVIYPSINTLRCWEPLVHLLHDYRGLVNSWDNILGSFNSARDRYVFFGGEGGGLTSLWCLLVCLKVGRPFMIFKSAAILPSLQTEKFFIHVVTFLSSKFALIPSFNTSPFTSYVRPSRYRTFAKWLLEHFPCWYCSVIHIILPFTAITGKR